MRTLAQDQLQKFQDQLRKYVARYGEGAVLWTNGFPASLRPPPGVTFFTQLES